MARDYLVDNTVCSLFVSPNYFTHVAGRFNPTFVLPIPDFLPETPKQSLLASTPITQQTRRRTAELRSKIIRSHIPIRGFQEVSFLKMVSVTGRVPPFGNLHLNDALSLEEIRRKSSKPIVVFPECTSSNGRGLLRFASVFRQTVPTKNYQVFVMSVRYSTSCSRSHLWRC